MTSKLDACLAKADAIIGDADTTDPFVLRQKQMLARYRRLRDLLQDGKYAKKELVILLSATEAARTMQDLDRIETDFSGVRMDTALAVADSISARCDAATAETERKWLIRGEYPDGKKLQFSVNAFDHADAKKKAEARKGGGKITDIVLQDKQ